MGDKAAGVQAIEAAIALDETARAALRRVVARKKLQGEDVEEERADIAELNREIADARDLLAATRASNEVVSAPSVEEIRQVTEIERAIRDRAVKDAMTQAGLEFIRQGILAAGELRGKVKV
jgi:hypothetical protein